MTRDPKLICFVVAAKVSEYHGKEFRVEEELAGLSGKHFGEVGIITKFDAENQIATITPSSGALLIGGAFKVPFSALKLFDSHAGRRGLKNMTCDELTKEALLIQMGFPDPMSIPEFDLVTLRKPEYIEQDQILMYKAMMEWTFEDLSFFIYHPQYILVLLEKIAADVEASEEHKANMIRIQQKFIQNLPNFQLHLFPIHSGVLGASRLERRRRHLWAGHRY